ncbi:MAG TPA: Uma2 family endonuclease [Lacipirellulaceae bacterium]|jgi:Uma2 family endonuclease|nr:Uma2 family endonuclease [Lacipirellulaceae bacterium]
MATVNRSLPQPTETCPNPAWEVALLFPSQGAWSESDYLALDTNRLVELVDGRLEVLPMPSVLHQLIVEFLHDALKNFVRKHRLGQAIFAPLPVRIREDTLREPDVIYISRERGVKPEDKRLEGADLVMEVVSPDEGSHERDYTKKRSDYASRKISEYWIVDPQTERIKVLALKGKQYRVHGEFAPGQEATSVLLEGFGVDVSAVFEAGRQVP